MKETAWTIGLILIVALTYVGGYAANLDEGVQYCFSAANGVHRTLPSYRVGGKGADYLFWPAFQADLQLRPDRWPERSPFGCVAMVCP